MSQSGRMMVLFREKGKVTDIPTSRFIYFSKSKQLHRVCRSFSSINMDLNFRYQRYDLPFVAFFFDSDYDIGSFER